MANGIPQRTSDIPREYMELVCYDCGGLADKIDFCLYINSKDCPRECHLTYDKPIRTGLQRFVDKYGVWRE